MKIGLIDADIMWSERVSGRRYGKTKADIFPNLVLMKISAWHKQQGDETGWYNGFDGWHDRVYISKVFSTTPDSKEIIQTSDVRYGGSGYCIKLVGGKEVWQEPSQLPLLRCNIMLPEPKNGYDMAAQVWLYQKELPYEIEHIMPDYSLYPTFKDTAIGFLTRGCPRGSHFCHVEAKEGLRSHKVANLSEWWSGQRNIVLCDPNLLACPDWKDLLQQLADSKANVDMNQGMDARLITPAKMEYINKVKWKTIHFAWDDYKQKDRVLKGLKCFADHFNKKFDKGHKAQVFVLTNFDTTQEQDLERIYTLRDMGFEPYVMVYDKKHAAPFYKSPQRWVNMRAIFHRIDRFEDYDKKKAAE